MAQEEGGNLGSELGGEEMAYPPLPEEAQRAFDNTARIYAVAIHGGHYDQALAVIKNLYHKMLGWQDKYHMRFHKGYPLHNIGYTLHLQDKHPDAEEYFVLAFIEDLLSADNEDEADSTPAGQTLLLGYKFTSALLETIKRKVRELKEEGRIPFTPEEIAQELKKSKAEFRNLQVAYMVIPKEAPLKPFTVFNMRWGKRVFVGGSIGLEFIIDKIADIVAELGYDPIVCHHFEAPKEMETDIHRKCLILLHCCKYAVFDIAEQTGQLIEVERACDYNVKTLVMWPKNKDTAITQMLKSQIDFQKITPALYEKIDDWKPTIQKFLLG